MVVDDICWKLYLWPILSHLANIKGICSNIKPVYTIPIITLPAGAVLSTSPPPTSTTPPTTIPTFQPTVPTYPTIPTPPSITTTTSASIPTFQPTITIIPTFQPTIPTVPTFQPYLPCPSSPVVCSPGGSSPIAYCPCIDSRFNTLTTLTAQMCISAMSTTGHCTTMTSCPHFFEKFYTNVPINSEDHSGYIGSSICGFDGVNFLICCPDNYQIGPTWNTQMLSNVFHFGSLNSNHPQTVTNTPQIVNMEIDSRQCGVSSTSVTRVVGGFEAKIGAYPWIAALGYNQPVQFLCSGSLITRQHVITAAHCISPSLHLVRLGAHYIYQEEEEAVDVSIKQTIVHEGFDPMSTQNDIAIIILTQPVPISNRISPLCIPVDNKYLKEDFIGSNPFVAGWGAVHFQGPSSPYLKDAQVPIVSSKECVESYKTIYNTEMILENLICAGQGFADTCQGDSGGPLMMPEVSKNGKTVNYYLIGIVSFGYECARPRFPGVYVKVSAYINWIQNKLNII